MCNIVIIDDEYLERHAIKHIASGIEGARVVGEGNCGRLAVELCSALKPDLLFLNCNMGGMDGFEAASKIRTVDSHVAIVMTTAYDKFSPKRDLESLNIADYLLKPVRPGKIEEIVRRYDKTGKPSVKPITPRKKKKLRFYPSQIMSREITRALLYIDANFSGDISLESVSEIVSLSSYYFSRLFKKEVGVTFSSYLVHKRLDRAKELLGTTDLSILEVSNAAGFQEQSYFCKVFKKHCGTTPTDYRKKVDNSKKERTRVVEKYQ